MSSVGPCVESTADENSARFRFVIREELLQGLHGLKSDLQESLRNILREELAHAFLQAESRPSDAGAPKRFSIAGLIKPTSMSKGVLHDLTQEDMQNLVCSDDDDQPRKGSAGTAMDGVLPGAVATTPKEASIKKASNGARKTCLHCGNVFLDDALFCRKCGTLRPGMCECGNELALDAVFCRKCGKPTDKTKREKEEPVRRRSRPSIAEMHADDPTMQVDYLNMNSEDSRNEKCPDTSTMSSTLSKQAPSSKKKKKGRAGKTLFQMTEEVDERTAMQRFTTHQYYEAFSGMLIVSNAFFLGFQTQYVAVTHRDNALQEQPLEEEPNAFFWINTVFCIFFLVELALRWYADGLVDFFKTEELRWNLFDILIVSSSCLETLLATIAMAIDMDSPDALQNVSVLRMLRVVRIVRVARVIRTYKVFRELRMMIYSIAGSMMNLLWVLVVLLLTFYLFGVSFTAAVGDFLNTTEKWQNEKNEELVASFGTVDKSVVALFMAMSGGNDWAQYYDALLLLPWLYPVSFLAFILFTLFAVVNIVTGVFVESALQANLKDKDIIVNEELQAKKRYLQSMQELFEDMDEDGKGTISLEEFQSKLKDEKVIAYFHVLKLDVSDATTLFQMIDYDRSNEVNINEFLEGCYRLQGESTAMDMKIMQFELQNLQHSSDGVHDILKEIKAVQMQQHAHLKLGSAPAVSPISEQTD